MDNRWHTYNARVISCKPVSSDVFLLEFAAPSIAAAACSGQFVTVKTGPAPLIRRPISVHDCDRDKGIVSLLIQIVGEATRELSKLQPGDTLSVCGPLGNGFNRLTDGKLLLVAGGIGIAPLLLAARIRQHDNPIIAVGAQTSQQLVCIDDFTALGLDVHIATDDGSCGRQGTVVEVVKDIVRDGLWEVWACGPEPMLASLKSELADKTVCQIALETVFACGVGACNCCVLPRPDGGYLRVCRDGPVVRAEEVVL